MGSLSSWEGSIFLSIDPKRWRYCQKTINPSIHWRQAIFGWVTVTNHSSCWPKWKSRIGERVTCLLNPSSCSKYCGLQCNALYMPSNTFQSPILKSSCLNIQPWILWYKFSGGTSLLMSISLFKHSKNASQEKFSPMSINQSLRHRNQLWRKLAKAWKR